MIEMKRFSLIFYLAIIFIILSGVIYFIHYLIFGDVHHIFIYMVGDLAFLPLEVLLVILMLERILAQREKKTRLQKMNMVAGTFFSEVGNYLLGDLLKYFSNRPEIIKNLNVTEKWGKKEFKEAIEYADHLKIEIDCRNVDLRSLKAFLTEKREFLLTLLSNPNLLEHDRFTDLLWAITHLDDELQARKDLNELPETDLKHLGIDIQRFYDHLASEWLDYIEHLHMNYRFLYSLVLRTHPFQDKPSAVIK
jgi:hypothetical protein